MVFVLRLVIPGSSLEPLILGLSQKETDVTQYEKIQNSFHRGETQQKNQHRRKFRGNDCREILFISCLNSPRKDNFSAQTANTRMISQIRVTIGTNNNWNKVLTDGRPQREMPGFYWSTSTEGPHKVDHGKEIFSLFLLITKGKRPYELSFSSSCPFINEYFIQHGTLCKSRVLQSEITWLLSD